MSWQCFANTSAVSAQVLVCSDWSTLLRTTWRRFIRPEEHKGVCYHICRFVSEWVFKDFSFLGEIKYLTGVCNSGSNEFVEQIIWDWASILVVARHSSERLLLPNPVLKHLRWYFNKVRFHQGSTEFGKSGLIQKWEKLRLFRSD